MDVVRFSHRPFVRACLSFVLLVSFGLSAKAAPLVPGTGQRATFDDFEDTNWGWEPNEPKSSSNIDNQVRDPAGMSSNARWNESRLRGQPDIVKRVATPAGGLPGSQGAMLMRTVKSGIPGMKTGKFQQDDLLFNAGMSTGGYIPVSWNPSVVVRVYLPPFEQWEKRTGASFALRTDVTGTFKKTTSARRGFFRRGPGIEHKVEPFWPGMFIQFNSKTDGQNTEDSAMILVRADENGQDVAGPRITQTGWWTLGMSFTSDGMVHYYAKPGVGTLTQADHIASTVPYGTRVENFNTLFFNIVNQDDGRTWSTEWIVDDPTIYWIRR